MIQRSQLAAINSATKYPSIPTFHVMGDKGILGDDHSVDPDQEWLVTEKVDGTNARLILLPDGDYLIGSREELLYFCEDLIINPSLGIVDRLLPIAEKITKRLTETVIVLYGEVYGGNVGRSARQYTASGMVGFRLFDIALIPKSVIGWQASVVSAWRDHGGQEFCDVFEVEKFAADWGLAQVPVLNTTFIARSHGEVWDWLNEVAPVTRATLDGGVGAAEGVVIRTENRSAIAKLRFEDYKRKLRPKVAR